MPSSFSGSGSASWFLATPQPPSGGPEEEQDQEEEEEEQEEVGEQEENRCSRINITSTDISL
jgi:hypothetical protein